MKNYLCRVLFCVVRYLPASYTPVVGKLSKKLRAVVTKDVPPYTIAAGNPAKVVKQLEEK